MSSDAHIAYQNRLTRFLETFGGLSDIRQQVELWADSIAILWHLDLEPARPILQAGYAEKPRGTTPWDPVLMLRTNLLSLLVGCPNYNAWVPLLRSSALLRAMAGFADPSPCDAAPKTPGVGTFYDFCRRLHDGPKRPACEHTVLPSEHDRRLSQTPQPVKARRVKKPTKRQRNVCQKLLQHLRDSRDQSNPDDLTHRLLRLLWEVAAESSMNRGLLGNPKALLIAGDGSILPTAANGNGVRVCDCGSFVRCDCPRRYRDPTAEWGYDSTRNTHFFGHRFWEASVSTEGHDLPLILRLDPANTSDHTAAMHGVESLAKYLRTHHPDVHIDIVALDAGHDSRANHEQLRDWQIRAVVPLAQPAPVAHPKRPDLRLSKRGVPLCAASVEMAPNGSAGRGRSMFICPVKAGKIPRCPMAPPEDPGWLCQPTTKWGPCRKLNAEDNPRLFPEIARNSPTYEKAYALRTGTERSNAMKKGRYRLQRCRHVRASLWQIRLTFIAILQHAQAWVRSLNTKAWSRELLASATGPPDEALASAA